jgi:hypothetical protein
MAKMMMASDKRIIDQPNILTPSVEARRIKASQLFRYYSFYL